MRVAFQNIVLSGGSSMFKHLDRRIQRDIKKMTDYRLKLTEENSHGKLKVRVALWWGAWGVVRVWGC